MKTCRRQAAHRLLLCKVATSFCYPLLCPAAVWRTAPVQHEIRMRSHLILTDLKSGTPVALFAVFLTKTAAQQVSEHT